MEDENRKILRTILNMAWPAILEAVFFSLTALVDSYMVSVLGENAVAGVGITAQPKFLGMAVCIAVNVALSALVARRFGQQNRRDANRIVITGLLFISVVTVFISMIAVVFAGNILDLCGATPDTREYGVTYFKIIMGGIIFNVLQMAINSAQRGIGNTRITMRTNVVSNILNIIFNYLLIGGNLGFPKLGIAGAAIATVLGTVVASIMSIASISKKSCFINIGYMISERIKPSISALKNITSVGYSIFLEQLLMRIGFMSTAIMAAHQGTSQMAAHQVSMHLLSLSYSFGDGIQSTVVALIGKSLGEEKPELAKRYGITCRIVAMIIAGALAIVYIVGARGIYSMFFDNPQVVDIGVSISHVLIAAILFQIPSVVYVGALRGAGDTLYTAISSTISVTIIRTSVSFFFGYVLKMGIVGIWFGIVGDQMSRFILSGIRFRQGKWTKIKI